MFKDASVEEWTAWAPGVEEPKGWESWAKGGVQLAASSALPALDFLPSLFKRRLGQLDRMVLHVGHGLMEGRGATRVVMASERGEVSQQYRISADVVECGEVSPAAFSHSVFNTPASLLSIAMENTGSASTVHSGPDSFIDALLISLSMLDRDPSPLALIVADENLPDAYACLDPLPNPPYGVAFLIGKGIGFRFEVEPERVSAAHPGDSALPTLPDALAFLRFLLVGGPFLPLGRAKNGLLIRRTA
jgi:hypothetical protein